MDWQRSESLHTFVGLSRGFIKRFSKYPTTDYDYLNDDFRCRLQNPEQFVRLFALGSLIL